VCLKAKNEPARCGFSSLKAKKTPEFCSKTWVCALEWHAREFQQVDFMEEENA
jgi:hypothetical protein